MKKLFFSATFITATMFSARAQSLAQPKMTIKEIDSIQIAGVPVNRLVIRNISLSDSVCVVSSGLVYIGKSPLVKRGQFSFSDAIPITNTTNVSISSIAATIAGLRGVNIKAGQ